MSNVISRILLRWRVILVAGICTIGLFVLHYIFPSMLTGYLPMTTWSWHRIDHTHMEYIVALHRDFSVFASRPLTTWSILALHHFTGLSNTCGFIVVDFSLLFVCGLLVYKLARVYGTTVRAATVSMVLFFTSATVLFAFFASIYVYDEPMQYVFLFLLLLCLERKRFWLGGMCLFSALVARETTVFLYPAIAFSVAALFFGSEKNWSSLTSCRSWVRVIVFLLIPLAAFLFFFFGFLSHRGLLSGSAEYMGATRFGHWAINMQNMQFALESFVSIILALGWQLGLVLHAVYAKSLDAKEKRLVWMTVISIVANTPIVLVSGLAREARLFALPLVFLWPILGSLFLQSCKRCFFLARAFFGEATSWSLGWFGYVLSVMFVSTLFVLYYSSFYIYTPTAPGFFEKGYQWYVFVSMMWMAVIAGLELWDRRTHTGKARSP